MTSGKDDALHEQGWKGASSASDWETRVYVGSAQCVRGDGDGRQNPVVGTEALEEPGGLPLICCCACGQLGALYRGRP